MVRLGLVTRLPKSYAPMCLYR